MLYDVIGYASIKSSAQTLGQPRINEEDRTQKLISKENSWARERRETVGLCECRL